MPDTQPWLIRVMRRVLPLRQVLRRIQVEGQFGEIHAREQLPSTLITFDLPQRFEMAGVNQTGCTQMAVITRCGDEMGGIVQRAGQRSKYVGADIRLITEGDQHAAYRLRQIAECIQGGVQ